MGQSFENEKIKASRHLYDTKALSRAGLEPGEKDIHSELHSDRDFEKRNKRTKGENGGV